MTFVVTESCIRCKYTECVDVCPVDAFREDEDVPEAQRGFTTLNAELASMWKPITRSKLALPDADEWAKIERKLDQLKR